MMRVNAEGVADKMLQIGFECGTASDPIERVSTVEIPCRSNVGSGRVDASEGIYSWGTDGFD